MGAPISANSAATNSAFTRMSNRLSRQDDGEARHGVRALLSGAPSKRAEQVLNRDQSDGAPARIGDDGGVDATLAQLRDRAIGRQALGHVHDRPQQPVEPDRPFGGVALDEVLHAQHADDVIAAAG